MHYNTIRYHKRRAILISLLGGKCSKCGSEENLHFHHVDRKNKSFNISNEMDRPWKEIIEEAMKCIILCVYCHKKEHASRHGLGMYSHHKCRCNICKKAWNEKTKEYKSRSKKNKAE